MMSELCNKIMFLQFLKSSRHMIVRIQFELSNYSVQFLFYFHTLI